MTLILNNRNALTQWASFYSIITSTINRIYVGWWGVIMIPTILTAIRVFIVAYIRSPPVDTDGIRELVTGSLLYGNNIIAGAVIITSNSIGLHFYLVWYATRIASFIYLFQYSKYKRIKFKQLKHSVDTSQQYLKPFRKCALS